MPYGSKFAASRSTVVVPSPISVSSPPMIPASAIDRSASAITRSSVTSSRTTPSRVVSFSPGAGAADDDLPAVERGEVEGVQRVPEREHHVVGDVDDVRDRPLPASEEPRPQPLRRGPDRDVLEQAADVPRAALEVVDPDRHRRSGATGLGTVPGHRPQAQVVEGRDLAREAVDATAGRAGCRSPRRGARGRRAAGRRRAACPARSRAAA